jgi:hypothetical protein
MVSGRCTKRSSCRAQRSKGNLSCGWTARYGRAAVCYRYPVDGHQKDESSAQSGSQAWDSGVRLSDRNEFVAGPLESHLCSFASVTSLGRGSTASLPLPSNLETMSLLARPPLEGMLSSNGFGEVMSKGSVGFRGKSETNMTLSSEFRWRMKNPRSRYVPVRRNFAVFCVFGVSKNQ